MTHVVVLIAPPQQPPLAQSRVDQALSLIRGTGASVAAAHWLARGEAVDLPFTGDPNAVDGAIAELVTAGPALDYAVLPVAQRRKRLLVADMDSTILQGETLDELAALVGIGEAVAAITMRSMRGEIDFAAALTERVAMLKGVAETKLAETAEGMRLMPGAKVLIRTMRAFGATTALATGGFTYFSKLVADWVGFDQHFANELLSADGTLTGEVGLPILGREAKQAILERLAAERGLPQAATMAVGDGANDLAMLGAAGMGVAYHAKPVVAAAAKVRIRHGDLTSLLFLQGYSASEWVFDA